MIKKILGLICIVVGVIMVITLFPTLVDGFNDAFAANEGIWQQLKAAVSALWGFVFQPLVLVVLGFIALGK